MREKGEGSDAPATLSSSACASSSIACPFMLACLAYLQVDEGSHRDMWGPRSRRTRTGAWGRSSNSEVEVLDRSNIIQDMRHDRVGSGHGGAIGEALHRAVWDVSPNFGDGIFPWHGVVSVCGVETEGRSKGEQGHWSRRVPLELDLCHLHNPKTGQGLGCMQV